MKRLVSWIILATVVFGGLIDSQADAGGGSIVVVEVLNDWTSACWPHTVVPRVEIRPSVLWASPLEVTVTLQGEWLDMDRQLSPIYSAGEIDGSLCHSYHGCVFRWQVEVTETAQYLELPVGVTCNEGVYLNAVSAVISWEGGTFADSADVHISAPVSTLFLPIIRR